VRDIYFFIYKEEVLKFLFTIPLLLCSLVFAKCRDEYIKEFSNSLTQQKWGECSDILYRWESETCCRDDIILISSLRTDLFILKDQMIEGALQSLETLQMLEREYVKDVINEEDWKFYRENDD